MEKYNISDLLKNVDGALLAAYEKNCLKKEGILKSVNEKYLRIRINPDSFKEILLTLIKPATFAIGMFAICVVEYFYKIPPNYAIGIISVFVIAWMLSAGMFLLLEKYTFEDQTVLEDFKNAVKALNPLDINVQKYTDASVRDILVVLAERVLETENDFDVIRMQKRRWTSEILLNGNLLQEYRVELNNAIEQAKKFGLEFKNEDLFSDARKRMERLNKTLTEK